MPAVTWKKLLATARYTVARCLMSGRWFGPLGLWLVGAVIVLCAHGPGVLIGVTSGLLCLPVTIWLTVTALRVDDKSQATVVATHVGSRTVARLGACLGAAAAAAVCGLVGTALAMALDTSHIPGTLTCAPGIQPAPLWEVLIALVPIHLAAIVFGCGIGLVCAPPLVRHMGHAVLVAAVVLAVVLLVPVAPFAQVLSQMGADAGCPWRWSPLLGACGAGLALGLVALVLGELVARRRD
jgi:hypothetical protein